MSLSEPLIPWPQVVKFVRQLSHDLRNHLNAIELESAFLSEIAQGAETKAEIKRLRGMTAEMSAHLQRLSERLVSVEPRTMPYLAKDLVEDLQARVKAAHPQVADAIEWQVSLGAEKVEVDPQLLLTAFAELFDNALTHDRGQGQLEFSASADCDAILFALREPKSQPLTTSADWGAQPLNDLRAGHYALGLFRARGIFQAHHATMEAKFDSTTAALVTSVRLPRADS